MNLPKLRFSIGSLLLMTAVIALLPAYYYAMTKANALEEQNERLKKVSGFIESGDPDRLYVRQLRCHFESCWQYRLLSPSNSAGLKLGVFEGDEPTLENVTVTVKDHVILPRDALLTLRLVKIRKEK